MTIFGSKPKKDRKLEKFVRSIVFQNEAMQEIRDMMRKLVAIAESHDAKLQLFFSSLETSLQAQVDALKKTEKFFSLQTKWTEEQLERVKKMEPTEDDARF